jgi:muramidase (phage lysozyme)
MYAGWGFEAVMSNRTRVTDQIRHYRELAQIAADCAIKSSTHAGEYLELSRQWFALANRLENDAREQLSPAANKAG